MHQDSNSLSRRDALTLAVAPFAATLFGAAASAALDHPKPELQPGTRISNDPEEKRVSALLWPASEECFHTFSDVTTGADLPWRRYLCQHCRIIVIAGVAIEDLEPFSSREMREARAARAKQLSDKIDEIVELGNRCWRSRPRD